MTAVDCCASTSLYAAKDPGSVGQAERGDAGTQLRVCTISGIHQDDALRQARIAGGGDLVESDSSAWS